MILSPQNIDKLIDIVDKISTRPDITAEHVNVINSILNLIREKPVTVIPNTAVPNITITPFNRLQDNHMHSIPYTSTVTVNTLPETSQLTTTHDLIHSEESETPSSNSIVIQKRKLKE